MLSIASYLKLSKNQGVDFFEGPGNPWSKFIGLVGAAWSPKK